MILTQLVHDPARERPQGQKIMLGHALHLSQQQIEQQVQELSVEILNEEISHDHVLDRHATTMAAETASCARYQEVCLRALGRQHTSGSRRPGPAPLMLRRKWTKRVSTAHSATSWS